MNTRITAQPKSSATAALPMRSSFSRKSETNHSSEIPAIVDDVLNSPGQPLDGPTRGFMEARFGHHLSGFGVASTATGWRSGEPKISGPGDTFEEQADRVASAAMRTDERAQAERSSRFDFSAVKIHTDSTASESARAVNAHAYTVGSHIVFGKGKFDPKSTAGRALLAHELAHVAQMRGRPTSERVPLLRQRAEESEDERRRQALESLNWLEAIPPIVMDDNAPVLIAWARTQAMKFEAPETSDDKRHYVAQGLLRVHKRLQEFEARAKRNPQGALIYTDILRESQTPWTEDGARSLDAIDPFTPSNIGEWKIAAKSPRAAARLGKQKKEKAQKQAAEQPEPRRDAEKVTFRKQKGMTFQTEEGQRQIAMYLMATIQSRSSINELAAAVSQIDLSKWWTPPTGGDLPTWQQEFEATDVGNEFTMVVSGKFIAEIGDLMMRGPKERDFMIEAVRRGVVESKYGLYLGIGTFVVGASALTGGAFLGTMLAPGGGLATGGVLSGGGLLGGGVGQSARAVGTYLYLNAPELYGSAMLYGGAVLTGAALGEHVLDIRTHGWQGLRREGPRFAEDVLPLFGGYAESTSMRISGGGRSAPEPPTEELGSTGGAIGTQAVKGSVSSTAQPASSGPRQIAGFRPPDYTEPTQPTVPEPQILTSITPSRSTSGFGRPPAPQPEPVPLTPGQTVFTEMPRAKVVQGNQPTYGSIAPAVEMPGQVPPPATTIRRVTGFQPPKDVAEKGLYVEREIDPRQYVAKEHFGEVNPLSGESEPRYYVNVKLDEHGMMDSDFVLRESGRRSGSLFGKDEFLQAKQYFEQKHGSGSVKGAYGKWSSGDNLDRFNTRYKVATDKGFSHDEALIEAARKTKTGEWARAAGFNRVNITKAEGQPGAFTNVEVEFTQVQPAVSAPPAPTGIPAQGAGPSSTPATQTPPAQVIPSSSGSTKAVGAPDTMGIRRDQPSVATAGKGPPGGEPKPNVPAPGRETTQQARQASPEPIVDEPTAPIPRGEAPGEVVGDYRLQGEAGLKGETFQRRILGITRIRPRTGERFRPLFESFIAEARATNAKTLQVTIEAIRNEKIFKNVLEIQEWIQSLGGTVTLPDLETVKVIIPL